MASKDLRVNVVVNAKTKQLDTMFKKINKVQTKLNRQVVAQNKVTNAVNKTNQSYKKQGTLIDQLSTKVHRLANAYLGVMAAKALVTSSDTITKAENKLNYINASSLGSAGYTTDASGNQVYSQATLDATQQSMDKMYASSQKVRMGYADMMTNVSKSMTLASGAFGGNIDNAIRFQEIMSEAYTLSGSSAAETSQSMYQMIQALSSGRLQGDELRSVREGASMAYKEIEKYAQGIYGADQSLEDLAASGKITSDIVVKAMLEAGTTIDAAFANTAMTFDQAWTNMKNTALKSFEPVLQKMNELLNSENGKKFVEGLSIAIAWVAELANVVFDIFSGVFNWLVQNWNWIKWIVISVLAAVTVYLLYMATQAIITGVSMFLSFLTGLAPLYIIIVVIGAIIALFVALTGTFSKALGTIVGGLNVAKVAFQKAIESIGVFFKNSFLSTKSMFWDFVAVLMNGILGIAQLANKVLGVFGVEINLSGLESSITNASAKAAEARSKMVDGKKIWEDGWAKDAYAKGYDVGFAGGEWVNDKLSSVGDKISGVLNGSGITPNLEDINGNTEVMADSMKLTAEDLKYLRDVANMEWKKEFTTANITVDMTNNNTVSNDFDLNSLAIGLRDLVEEEMFAVANGVYA